MKRTLLFVVVALLVIANTAMADSIKGKFGITARGGASYIFNSEFTDEAINDVLPDVLDKDIKADIGWTVGGGFMYGITDNLAVTVDVIYLQTNLNATYNAVEEKIAKGKTVDFSLGAQWRFMPKSRFVPYIGAGVDVMWNDFDAEGDFDEVGVKIEVDPTFGGHLSAGADFFITPNIALNAEIRGLLSTKGDITIKVPGELDFEAAKYNPTNISGFVGIRFFFP